MKEIKVKKVSHTFHLIMTFVGILFTGWPIWIVIWWLAAREAKKHNDLVNAIRVAVHTPVEG